MKVQDFWKARLGEWVFGSVVAWGCMLPYGGVSDLLGGQSGGHCSATTTMPCQGMSPCSSYSYCQCVYGSGSGVCEPVQFYCPTGCYSPSQPSRCTSGSMNNCYYPT